MRTLIIALTLATLGLMSTAYADESAVVPGSNGTKVEASKEAPKATKHKKDKMKKQKAKESKSIEAPAKPEGQSAPQSENTNK